MNDEERAREFSLGWYGTDRKQAIHGVFTLRLADAFAAVRAEEREACAKMVEESAGCVINHPWGKAREVAAAIRASGKGQMQHER
jgi:hypothetical protein